MSANFASAENPCAAQYRISTALIETLVQYHADVDATARRTLWRTAQHELGALGDIELHDQCDMPSTQRYLLANGLYEVLAMASGSRSVETVTLSAALSKVVDGTLQLGQPQPDHGHDLDAFSDIPGFDADFFRSMIAEIMLLYRTNHLKLDDNKVNAHFLQYWVPDSETGPL